MPTPFLARGALLLGLGGLLLALSAGFPAIAAPPPAVPPSAAGMPAGRLQLLGVSLSGAEFNDPRTGRENTDYIYPNTAELDYYSSIGMNVVRLVLSWERIQPTQDGPLDTHQLAKMDDLVTYGAGKGLKVVIDLHNYGYRDQDLSRHGGNLVGSPASPDSALANVWSKLAAHYLKHPNVMFGLMNEPHVQSAAQWASAAQASIDAIRATGATQEILVPGSYWTGAHSWTKSDNASVMGRVTDPGHNMAFELHQYLDTDNSGTHDTVVSPTIGPERLADATAWAKAAGHRLVLGEFGAASDPASLTALGNMLAYLQQHSDVWQGAIYFAGGPWMGTYMFNTDPVSGTNSDPAHGVPRAQATLLSRYAPNPKVLTPHRGGQAP